ncbi:MAG: hypothetical protein LUB61_07675 [Eggerthellaceae bacterium]|nr:hypothetical protein [Eggerthellaceae bacterium]
MTVATNASVRNAPHTPTKNDPIHHQMTLLLIDSNAMIAEDARANPAKPTGGSFAMKLPANKSPIAMPMYPIVEYREMLE